MKFFGGFIIGMAVGAGIYHAITHWGKFVPPTVDDKDKKQIEGQLQKIKKNAGPDASIQP